MTQYCHFPLLFAYGSILLWTLVAAYALMITTLIVAVLSENRNPLKALGWVMALLLFPIGGTILYFVFGRSMRNVKMISRRNRRKLLKENTELTTSILMDDYRLGPVSDESFDLFYIARK